MKPNFLKPLIGLTLAIFLVAGCQQEELVNPTNERISVRSPHFSYSPSNPLCLGDQVTVTFDNLYNNNCGNIHIQQWIGGTWVQVSMGSPTNGKSSYTFTPTTTGNYRFRGSWGATGGPSCSSTGANIGFTEEAPLVVIECGCAYDGNAFSGTAAANSCGGSRGATYTLTSEEGIAYFKIQGGLTNFTGADAQVWINGNPVTFSYTSSDDWLSGVADGYTVGQRTPGNSSNRNIRVEGSLDECDIITIHITWGSSNNGGVITGEWTAKDSNGVNLATPIAGLACTL